MLTEHARHIDFCPLSKICKNCEGNQICGRQIKPLLDAILIILTNQQSPEYFRLMNYLDDKYANLNPSKFNFKLTLNQIPSWLRKFQTELDDSHAQDNYTRTGYASPRAGRRFSRRS